MVAMTLQTNLMTLDRKSAMTSGVAGTAMPARKGAMRTASALQTNRTTPNWKSAMTSGPVGIATLARTGAMRTASAIMRNGQASPPK